MQSTVECSGCFECTLPCLPSNLQKGLLPAPGRTGWRGSTLEDTALGGGVYGVDYNEKYDSKLQIFRTFKGAGWGSLSEDELKFVKEGGIMFFSVHDTAWADIAAGKMDWALKEYVDQFKAVYPAKMFFCMTYEPELEAEGNMAGRHAAGSSADYRAQWIYTHNYFKANGVTNAVWAMDYSTESRTEAYWPLVASLWPGDEYVDWLFFNIFTYSSTRGWSFDDMLSAEYNAYESMSGVEQEWMGEKYTVDYTTKPWGIGAWGAGGVLVFRMIDEPDRINFIKGAEEALNSDKYPRLHLQVYFDSTDGNTGMTCEIGNATWGRMGKGSDTDFTVTSNEPMFDAYKHFISSDYFSANDMSCALPTSGVYPGVDGLLGTAAVEEYIEESNSQLREIVMARKEPRKLLIQPHMAAAPDGGGTVWYALTTRYEGTRTATATRRATRASRRRPPTRRATTRRRTRARRYRRHVRGVQQRRRGRRRAVLPDPRRQARHDGVRLGRRHEGQLGGFKVYETSEQGFNRRYLRRCPVASILRDIRAARAVPLGPSAVILRGGGRR